MAHPTPYEYIPIIRPSHFSLVRSPRADMLRTRSNGIGFAIFTRFGAMTEDKKILRHAITAKYKRDNLLFIRDLSRYVSKLEKKNIYIYLIDIYVLKHINLSKDIWRLNLLI